jgi:hypothetical protein
MCYIRETEELEVRTRIYFSKAWYRSGAGLRAEHVDDREDTQASLLERRYERRDLKY